jgi:protein gp37
VQAAEDAGLESMRAEIRDGTRADALWDAIGSNCEHDTVGLRRSNADKRRAVEMALQAKHAMGRRISDNEIAKHVGVDHKTVTALRTRILGNSQDMPRTVEVERNGQNYLMEVGNIGRRNSGEDDYWKRVEEAQTNPFIYHSTAAEGETRQTRPMFNQTNEMVDWARWTWNPVTGCEHTCVYCYARDIANRFYAEKFKPTFHAERLEAPENTRRPKEADSVDRIQATAWRNVFVCSMADLFGRWVPDEWIDNVFASCRQSPAWNYLFLTKFPQRYVGLDFPETSWVGTSVDEQKRVSNAEKAFAKIDVPVKWLSVEPMRERIVFGDLSMFDWVVIGGQSRSSGAPEFHPEPWWVFDLIHEAREAGCKVYLKPNTFADLGWQIKEYPALFTQEHP